MRSQILVGLTARGAWLAAMWVVMAAMSGCAYESSSLSGLLCEEEGKREGARVCRDGVWVQEGGEDLPVADLPDEGDLPGDLADEGDLAPDMDADMCVPESDQALCLRAGAACGSKTAADNCGVMRTVADCGVCPDSGVCQPDNTCGACVPEDDATLCARLGKTCGLLTATDSCGQQRADVGCGACQGASDQCVDNQCVCQPETTEQYCGRLGAQCGLVRQGVDNCGQTRVDVMCGTCAQGACEAGNTCSVCQAESDAAFCARNGATCGSKTAMDNCGQMRTVNSCGACSNGQTCDATNQCICPAPVCPGTAECGSVSNACGRSTPCGSMNGACMAGEVCGNNQCDCPSPVCPQGAQCGEVTNACGGMTQCGPMNGLCAPGSICQGNACVCTPESDAAFCARAPAAVCGAKTAADNCGQMRTVNNCGSCMAGQMCTSGACVCAPESDAAFCARAPAAVCGSKTAADNCGMMRTVNSCGMCGAGESCNGMNQCVAACQAESDAAFCARTGATCGSKTAADSCGVMRTVASCGACMNGQVCGAAMDNTCGDVVITAQMPNPRSNDLFGHSVVLRGDLLIIGRPELNKLDGNNDTVVDDMGGVHIYRRSGAAWAHVQLLTPEDGGGTASARDNFGAAVAFDGTTLVVGAPQYNILQDQIVSGDPKGYVQVYTLNGGTGLFNHQQRLTPSGGTNVSGSARFGWSVAVSGDKLAVGAPDDDDGGMKQSAGAVVTYTRSGSTWSALAKLRINTNRNGGLPSSTEAGDSFGFSVAMDGDLLAVGAPLVDTNSVSNAGVALFFEFVSNVWQRRNVLDPTDRSADAFLGASVAVLGARAVVGATGADTMVSDSGAAYVVETPLMAGGTVTRLVASNAASNDRFGFGVSLANNRLMVGANRRDISGRADAGTAYLFDFAAGMWTQREQQAPAGSSAANDRFGYAVSVDGARAAIAAPWRTSSGQNDAGAVFIFEY